MIRLKQECLLNNGLVLYCGTQGKLIYKYSESRACVLFKVTGQEMLVDIHTHLFDESPVEDHIWPPKNEGHG